MNQDQERINQLEEEVKALKKKELATGSIVQTVLEIKESNLLLLDVYQLNKMREEASRYIQLMQRDHPDLPETKSLGDESLYDGICQDVLQLWTNLSQDKEEYYRVMGEEVEKHPYE